jgi:cytochrome c oxidase subunit 2
MWFRATETGVYPLFCTEYCGDKHSEMLGRVFVDTQADFDAWYTKYSDPETLYPDPIERGKYFYNSRGCAQCHSLDGSTKVNGGPSFLGNFGKSVEFEGAPSQIVDENYIRESILQPLLKIRKGYGKIMPAGLITKEKEIDALILFIKELNKPTGAK